MAAIQIEPYRDGNSLCRSFLPQDFIQIEPYRDGNSATPNATCSGVDSNRTVSGWKPVCCVRFRIILSFKSNRIGMETNAITTKHSHTPIQIEPYRDGNRGETHVLSLYQFKSNRIGMETLSLAPSCDETYSNRTVSGWKLRRAFQICKPEHSNRTVSGWKLRRLRGVRTRPFKSNRIGMETPPL